MTPRREVRSGLSGVESADKEDRDIHVREGEKFKRKK